jgi:hypothetical protein
MHKASMELWQRLADSHAEGAAAQGQLTTLKQAMLEMVAKHNNTIRDLEDKLSKSARKEQERRADNAELQQKIERMKTKNLTHVEGFQQKIVKMMSENDAAKEECDDIRDEMTTERSKYQAEIANLCSELQESQPARQSLQGSQRSANQEQLAEENTRLQGTLDSTKKKLEEARKQNESLQSKAMGSSQVEAEVESLRQQLVFAIEAKRIAESRVEDMKREVLSMERKHATIVNELKNSRMRQSASTSSIETSSHVAARESGDTKASELESLRHQIRSLTEDRNRMANSFEAKEVHWKTQLDDTEQQHAANIAVLTLTHKMQIKELDAKAKAAASSAKEERDVEPKLQARSRGGILDLLRCPMRFSDGGLGESPRSSQEICWRVLVSLKDIACVLCHISNFKIIEASKTACKLWGSAALQGQSILDLVNGPSRAAWLRKAFETHQRFAETQVEESRAPGLQGNTTSSAIPGFLVRDLGCEEFVSKGGHIFDASVITAHLPAEPSCGRRAALLVVIEPHHELPCSSAPKNLPADAGGVDHSSQETNKSQKRELLHNGSEVSTSTVNPSDSASNILDRYDYQVCANY